MHLREASARLHLFLLAGAAATHIFGDTLACTHVVSVVMASVVMASVMASVLVFLFICESLPMPVSINVKIHHDCHGR